MTAARLTHPPVFDHTTIISHRTAFCTCGWEEDTPLYLPLDFVYRHAITHKKFEVIDIRENQTQRA